MQEYIVSARKYRPMTFDSVVGQMALTTTLKNAVKSGKLAHAYLFCGPRGVGKTTCARIFAKVINCEHPTAEGEACGECESCKAFAEGRSYNIFELDAASNNSVENIKQLMDQTRVPPQVGRYKVFIIDEVHMLSSQANMRAPVRYIQHTAFWFHIVAKQPAPMTISIPPMRKMALCTLFSCFIFGSFGLFVVAQYIDVLVGGLHEIALACNFLVCPRILLELAQLSGIGLVALLVFGDFFFQIADLYAQLSPTDKAVVIEKTHDGCAHHNGDGVFVVFEEGPDRRQTIHCFFGIYLQTYYNFFSRGYTNRKFYSKFAKVTG